jgi:hypothetical protein
MKRPSRAGLLVLLAFLIPVIIELRTVLSMLGIEVSSGPYLGVMIAMVVLATIAIFLLPEKREGNPSRA